MPPVIQAVFTVAGETFATKKEAEHYGTIADQVDTWAGQNGLTESEVEVILLAYKAGVLALPKAERKPRTPKA